MPDVFRRAVALLLLLGLLAPSVSAQRAQTENERLLRRARGKTISGIALMAFGLVVLPSSLDKEKDVDDAMPLMAVGSMMVGGVLLWSGAQDRRKAFPQTRIGVMVGRTTSVQIKRTW